MRVLVLGGTGFIGASLVEVLVSLEKSVCVASRHLKNGFIGLKPGVNFSCVDLLDSSDNFERLVDGFDIVFNCAGEIKVEKLMKSLHVDATCRLVEACKKVALTAGRPIHYVQLSSVGAYGPSHSASEPRTVTELTPHAPVGTYEITKTMADDIVVEAAEQGVFTYSILRPSNVYGAGMPNNSIRQWGQVIKKRLFFYIGKPGAVSTYIHVDDVVDALMLCGFDERAKGQVFNISNDCPQERFVGAIAQALNVPAPRLRLPESLMRFMVSTLSWTNRFPVSHSRIDALVARTRYPADKISTVLGFYPTRGVEGSIKGVFYDERACTNDKR